MIVVEVHHQGSDRQVLVAAGRTMPRRAFEKIEQPPHPRPVPADVTRQQKDAFVGGAEGIRAAVLPEVLTEGLNGPALDAGHDGLSKIGGFLAVVGCGHMPPRYCAPILNPRAGKSILQATWGRGGRSR